MLHTASSRLFTAHSTWTYIFGKRVSIFVCTFLLFENGVCVCARWRLLVNIKQQGKKQYLQPAGRFCFYIVWHFSRYIFERARVRTRSFAYICIVFSIYFAPNAYWSSSLGCRLRVHYDEQIHNFLIYISLESALFGFLFFLSRMWKCFFFHRDCCCYCAILRLLSIFARTQQEHLNTRYLLNILLFIARQINELYMESV